MDGKDAFNLKKIFLFILALLLMTSQVFAGTYTTNNSLYKPTISETGWGATVNSNMDILDALLNQAVLTTSSPTFAALTIPTLTLSGTGTINGLDSIDATGEATLEAALDIAGDVSSTGMATTIIGSDKILEAMLKSVNAATDEYFLTYELTTGDFEWQAGGGSGDSITVDGTAVTDPDFGDTGDINFTATSNKITGAVKANSVALATDTTGNYADSNTEAGSATSGVSATGFFPTGSIEASVGGTGATTLTDGGILLGSGTGAITPLGVATNGQIPIGDGATDPVLGTITAGSGITITNGAGTITAAVTSGDFFDSATYAGLDFLVGTATGALSAEIVAGTAPGGELGGTWGTPTIDDSITVTGWEMGTFTGGAYTGSGKIIGNASLDVKNGVTSSGVIAIFEDSDAGTNKATFQVPAIAADTVYILPVDDGTAAQVLETNGTGTLSWGTDDTGAGGGDAITVDGVAAVDPDFGDTGQIGFTMSSNKITADIDADAIVASDIGAGVIPVIKGMSIETPVANDRGLIYKSSGVWTAYNLSGVIEPDANTSADTASVSFWECSDDGDSQTLIGTIVVTADAVSDSSLVGQVIDNNDWVMIRVNSIGGNPTQVTGQVDGTEN